MNKQITLREYSYIFVGTKDFNGNVAVTQPIFDELESFILQNIDTVQYLKLGQKKQHKYLQAQNYVGVIQTKNGTTIEILPKIAKVNSEADTKKILIKMLRTLKKSPFKNFNMANLKSTNMPLLEIFISMFLSELDDLIKKGIKSEYIDKEENLKFVRGKLKFNEHIKRNSIHKERFYMQYQEFTIDRLENRLIKTTLEYLYKKSKSNKNAKHIRELLFVFDEVKVSHNHKLDFSKVRPNRQMKDYELVLQWCHTFLLSDSFTPYHGSEVSFALLFDMNLLFESYMGHLLKRQDLDVSLQDREHHLAYLNMQEGKFQLKPDFVIRHDAEVIIADTKWKLLSEDKSHQGVSQADMYQLYAYGTKYKNPQCKKLFLIYPKSENDLYEHQYYYEQVVDGLQLKVVFFDLLNPTDEFYKNFLEDKERV